MFSPMTFNCDLDIEAAWLIMGIAYPRTEMNILSKRNANYSMGKGILEYTRNQRLNSIIFNCYPDLESA